MYLMTKAPYELRGVAFFGEDPLLISWSSSSSSFSSFQPPSWAGAGMEMLELWELRAWKPEKKNIRRLE